MQALPQVFAQQNSTISNGATGTATVDLRHLGPERTLTLVNGHRMAPGDAFEAGGDMNFVPAALVKRVDILTGGASSAYGADAVAGVVNFVLDTEFEGFRGARPVERLPAQQQQRPRPGDQRGPGLHRSERQHLQPRRLELQPGRGREDRRRQGPRLRVHRLPRHRGHLEGRAGLHQLLRPGPGRGRPGLRRLRHLAARALPGAGARGLRPGPGHGQHQHLPAAAGHRRVQLRPLQLHAAQRPEVGRAAPSPTTRSASTSSRTPK